MFFISKTNRYRQHIYFFIFICKISCSINEKDARDIIFEVLTKSKILQRLNLSDDFWKRFNGQDKFKKKQVGLYEIENIEILISKPSQ